MTGHGPTSGVLSHWSLLIENFQTSPLAFYDALDVALKQRDIPVTTNERVLYKEAGIVSANREYLRIARETLIFDVCAAPYGSGFFISWWLADARSGLPMVARIGIAFLIAVLTIWLWSVAGVATWLLLVTVLLLGSAVLFDELVRNGTMADAVARSVPLVGNIYVAMFKPDTYFRIDSMEMFQKAAHNAVLDVIDAMTNEKGLRALTESERKPTMREFYRRQ